MSAFVVSSVSSVDGFSGVGRIDVGNWLFGGGFTGFVFFVSAVVVKGGF